MSRTCVLTASSAKLRTILIFSLITKIGLKFIKPYCFYSHKDKPYRFQLGTGEVIEGFDEGLVKMCPGEKRKITVPPHMGYGHKGGRTYIFQAL